MRVVYNAAFCVCSVLCATARVLLSSISSPPAEEAVPNSRICSCSVLSRVVRSSARWEVKREYRHEVLAGAVVKLQSDKDLPKLADVSNVEFIAPTRLYASPRSISSSELNKTRRAITRHVPWTHVATGVDKLHAEGYRGRGIKIGIIDSGVDYTHPLLGSGIGPGHKVIGGHDFVGDAYRGPDGPDPQPSDDPLDQCDGHGTVTAGVIGANPGNPHGIIGVAPEAKINAYRVMGCEGYATDDIIIDAILRAQRDGNHIINLSIESRSGSLNLLLDRVMRGVAKQGVVVVTAIGNRGEEGYWSGWHPSCALGPMTVGSVGRSTRLIHDADRSTDGLLMDSDSSFGPANDLYQAPSLAAPGVDIRALAPVALGSFWTVTGTSSAAPFVAGAVALWLQARKHLPQNTEAICAAFQNTAVPLRRDQGADTLLETTSRQGAGVIHAYNAVHTMSRMEPAELALNDTVHFTGNWDIRIRNLRGHQVTYTLTHVPAGAISTMEATNPIVGSTPLLPSYATVSFSVGRIFVPARSDEWFAISITPPTGLDPTTFPLYSGYVQATGSDGSVLRSQYIGLAASMKDIQVLDTSDRWYGTKLMDRKNDMVGPNTVFTMVGDDVPTLRLRLIGPSPYVRVELLVVIPEVPSHGYAATGKSTLRHSSLSRSSSSLKCFFRSRSSPSRKMNPAHAGLGILGHTHIWKNVGRHAVKEGMKGKLFFDRKIIEYGRARNPIPDGKYRVRVRAQKMMSNPEDPDWETWMSPQFSVKRPIKHGE